MNQSFIMAVMLLKFFYYHYNSTNFTTSDDINKKNYHPIVFTVYNFQKLNNHDTTYSIMTVTNIFLTKTLFPAIKSEMPSSLRNLISE